MSRARMSRARAERQSSRNVLWLGVPTPCAAAWLLATLGCAAVLVPPVHAEDAAVRSGQTLAEALDLLASEHRLRTVYSAALVTPTMRVGAVPQGHGAARLRDALLAEHGLACVHTLNLCVVRAAAGQQGLPGADAAPGPPTTSRLQTVQVEAGVYALGGQDASFLDTDDVAATPHFADDAFRFVRNLPGVAASDYGAPFHVRGSQQDEVAVRLDGFELYRPFHLQNLLSAFSIVDSNLIGGVDVYTGAWPSRLGGRNGAVMDIRSREPGPEPERRLGVSAVNLFYAHAQQFGEGDQGVLFSARRGYLDFVLDWVDPGGEVSPGYHDLFSRYHVRIDDRHELSFNLLSAGDDVVYEGDDGTERSEGRTRSDYLWGRWIADWNDSLRSESLLGFSRLDQRRDGYAFDAFESELDVRDRRELDSLRLSQRFEIALSSGLLLDTGLEYKDEQTDYAYRAFGEYFAILSREPIVLDRAFVGRRDSQTVSAWFDGEYALGDSWLLRGGLRHVRHEVGGVDDSHVDPMLSLAWLPSGQTVWRIAYSGVTQGQRSDELPVEDGESVFHRSERARQLVLGWEHVDDSGLRWRVEAYDKRWHDLRPRYQNLFEPVELFPETEGDRILVDAERARARGIEIGVDGRIEQGRWWARYVYSKAEERVDGAWFARSWDQPHALNAGLDKTFDNGWRLSAQVEAHSGWPTTPVSARRAVDGSIVIEQGRRNSGRFDSYINVSARIGKTWPLKTGSLTWYFEVFNLLNQENLDMVTQFDLRLREDGGLAVVREFGGGLPFLPSFGVVWKF